MKYPVKKLVSILCTVSILFGICLFVPVSADSIATDSLTLSEKAKQSLLSEYSQYGTQLSNNGYITVNLALYGDTVFTLTQNGVDYDTATMNVAERQETFIKSINKKLNENKIVSTNSYLVNNVTVEVCESELSALLSLPGIESASFSGSFSLPETGLDYAKLSDEELTTSVINPAAGEDIVIAVIDSGINPEHESMTLDSGVSVAIDEANANEKINELGYGRYYSNKIPFYFNYADSDYNIVQSTADFAHGMHVAGIAAGNSKYAMGVAPNAQILALRVFSDKTEYSQDYDIVRAIEDAVFLGADVINLSLGSLSQGTEETALGLYQKAIDAAKQAGVLLVAAAGNSSEADSSASYDTSLDNGTVSAPACFDGFLSVGSVCNQKVSEFSSRGASAELEFQPMILAPGENILSAVNEGYAYASGTSMSSPYMAATSAIVKKQLKNKYGLQGDELVNTVYNILMNTADILGGENTYTTREQGAGAVNLTNAQNCSVTVTNEDGEAGFSLHDFDVTTDKLTRTLVLKNYGTTDITYTTSWRPCTNAYSENTSIPDHTVSFSSQTVTVKAGETATVNFTIDINNAIDDYRYIEGYLIFTPNDNSPVLHASYMGFCGDWSEGKLFANGKGIFKPQLAAVIDDDSYTLAVTDTFSPNGDGLCDYIYPLFYQYRNSSVIQTSILNSNGEKVVSGNNVNYICKDIYQNYWGYSNLITKYSYFPELSYLATSPEYYSETYDDFLPLPDGKYVLRVEGKTLCKDSETEHLDIPFTVDTTVPKISSYTLEHKNGMYCVTFTVDNESSLAVTPENNTAYAVVTSYDTGDSQNVELKKLSNGQYSGEFFSTGEIFSLGVFDSAYNFGEANITADPSINNIKDVIYCSLDDISYYNTDNVIASDKYTSSGYDSVLSFYAQMGDSISSVKAYAQSSLNGETSTIQLYGEFNEENNNIFNFEVPVGKTIDGKSVYETTQYKIWFEVTDANGTRGSINDGYSLIFIPELPKIILDSDVITVSPGKSCIISGRISSDLVKAATGLYINNQTVNILSDNQGYYFRYTLPYIPTASEWASLFLTDVTGNGLFSRVYLIVDNNYNIAENNTSLSMDNLAGSINFISLSDENYNTQTGIYKVKGQISNRYSNLYINGTKIESFTYNNLTDLYGFEADIPIVEGKNIVTITSDGYENGVYNKILFENAYYVVFDGTPPQLSLNIEKEELPEWLNDYFDGICINETGNFSFRISSSDNIDRLNFLYINEQLYFSGDLYSGISVDYNNSIDTPEILNALVYDNAGNYTYECLLLAKAMPIRGDFNFDSSVTAADALSVLRCSVDLDTTSVLNTLICDVNSDGKLTAADALLILQYSVQKIDSF